MSSLQQPDSSTAAEQEGGHAHVWVEKQKTVHHDAQYAPVHHDAVTAKRTEYHTVCDICGAAVDLDAAAHERETGHTRFTVNVPKEVEFVKEAAYDEQVLSSPAYDEQVADGYVCAECGAIKPAG